MDKLGGIGIMNLLCEGGGELAGQLVREGLVDAFEFFVAPKILGGNAVPVIGGRGWNLKDVPEVKFIDTRMVGRDIWLRAIKK
jgi:diaminohydroxyphosphoribosylaminopyrimidine deaminase/5-amino-6-(5-phosphoribosylamino)uracil reductase